MDSNNLSHGRDWNGEDPAGWLVSEKLDGCRAFWDGSQLLTRTGNRIDAPTWFVAGLPRNLTLDGEVWAGRGRFEAARVAVQCGAEHFTRRLVFATFDSPSTAGNWRNRMEAARHAIHKARHALAVEWRVCPGLDDLKRELSRVRKIGGEGLMLRHPLAEYEPGRTKTLLKFK